MFDKIKKELYFSKMQLLLKKGIQEGNIVPFDDDFYEKMNHIFLSCIPVSMHIKYLKPILPPGKCYDRSLLMFFCFDNALLVRGNKKDLEYNYGKEHAGHGWIEIDDYVYDPTSMMRFTRDLYYKIYNPTDVERITKEDYKKENEEFYYDVINTSISDFRPGGNKRTDLCTTIPLIRGIAEASKNESFKKELNDYLSLIQYDEKQVYEELISKCNKCIKK